MKKVAFSNVNPFVLASYVVSVVGLAVSASVLHIGPKLALIPLAAVFGWMQLGSL
jgi:hypothetical protein